MIYEEKDEHDINLNIHYTIPDELQSKVNVYE